MALFARLAGYVTTRGGLAVHYTTDGSVQDDERASVAVRYRWGRELLLVLAVDAGTVKLRHMARVGEWQSMDAVA